MSQINVEKLYKNINKKETDEFKNDEIGQYLIYMIDNEIPINKRTLKTYCYTLLKVKRMSGCNSLKDFANENNAKEYWKRLKKSIREENLSVSYSNIIISALMNYCEIKKIKLPSEITHINSSSISEAAIKEHLQWGRTKEDTIRFFNENPGEVKKIYTADLSELSDKRTVQEMVRNAVSEFFYAGKRISEVVASKFSDEFVIKHDNVNYRGIRVYSEKTKRDFEKIILEESYWKARDNYKELLNREQQSNNETITDEMFPGISTERLTQLIAGYNYTYFVKDEKHPDRQKKETARKKGFAEIVWGDEHRVWTHIFRHSRLTELAGVMPLEALQEWAGHTAIATTAGYVGRAKKQEMILDALKKKPKDNWS